MNKPAFRPRRTILGFSALFASLATFAFSAAPAFAAQQTLEVESGGGGVGTITSSPAGINCSNDICEAQFEEGAEVTLSASPEPGSLFAGWSGCESEPSATECKVTLSEFKRVAGVFEPVPQENLEVSVFGNGSVSADKGLISGCTSSGGVCSDNYEEGTEVTLTETPAAHQKFVEWSGCTSEPSPTECKVTLNTDTVVTASFEPVVKNLEVSVFGNGSVSADKGLISGCTSSGGVCSDNYEEGTEVTLTETPAAHQKFVEWSGCTSEPSPTECKVTLNTDTVVTASFEPVVKNLEVSVFGNGSVSADKGLISGCTSSGGVCSDNYEEGTEVTLTETPAAHQKFVEWSGCTSEPSPTECKVTLNTDTVVTASFEPVVKNLEVSVFGNGSVSADKGLISGCTSSGGVCSDNYEEGTEVTLTETPAAHQKFVEWSGCTSEPSPTECKVTLNTDTVVTASFEPVVKNLEVSVFGNGSVSADKGLISGCTSSGGVCSDNYEEGTEVTLTETPAAHQKFVEWSGCTSEPSPTECKVTLNTDTVVTASFEPVYAYLEVSKSGSGSGSVSSSPAGINCGSSCSHSYEEGTEVTLTATAASGSTFSGWSGGGCAGTGPCKITLGPVTIVTATFTQNPPPIEEPSNKFTIGAAKPHGSTVGLKVTVPGPGTLVASGKNLKKTKVSPKGASTGTLKLKLNGSGQKELKRRHKLKVKVKVTYTPTGGKAKTATKTVTFKSK